MKNVDEKMEAITGKRTERQRQEIIDQRKALKDAERENHSFAFDLLMEFKALNKRLFVIILVVLGLWFATIGGFVWYLNQYDFASETTTTTTEIEASQDGNGINIVGGGDVTNGAESKDYENKDGNAPNANK